MATQSRRDSRAVSERRAGRRGGLLSRWIRDDRGTVVILSAILLPVVLLTVGFGIDYSNALRVRTTVTAALDAALLATARDLSIGAIEEDEVDQSVNTYFAANLAGSNLSGTEVGPVVTGVNTLTGTVSGDVEADVGTAFAGLLNKDALTVGSSGQATYNLLNIELALVLDVTGSMWGQKLADMKLAAKDLIDLLIPDENGNNGGLDKVRISIVPYSDLVNVGDYEQAITGYSSGESCVYERRGTFAASDTAPVGPVDGFGPDDNGITDTSQSFCGNRSAKAVINDQKNFRGFACSNPSLMPLNGDKATLKTKIDSFTASGCTAGHIGIQIGWHTLSPKWTDVWPGESEPRDYGENDNLKVLIVMSDGRFNTWFENGQGNSYTQGSALCGNIKDEDVLIYSVAFQAPQSAETFLRNCASGPDYYFETSSGTALRAAFEEIAQRLRALRLSS